MAGLPFPLQQVMLVQGGSRGTAAMVQQIIREEGLKAWNLGKPSNFNPKTVAESTNSPVWNLELWVETSPL